MKPSKSAASPKTKNAQPISRIVAALESRAPRSVAARWDNVGLLIGDAQARTSGAIVSVDLTREALNAAKKSGYRLIINHHPCLFPTAGGLSRLTTDGQSSAEAVASQSLSSLIHDCARAGVAVYCSHTNFDQCALEVPHAFASALGLEPLGRLMESGGGSKDAPLKKLVVFVPTKDAQSLRDALAAAGAGQIGNYDSCFFSTEGEGTFRGLSGANPAIGKRGRLERVRETRVETVFPAGLEPQVLRAMREAHPYEEIAYDLYALTQSPGKAGLVSGLGYGVYGDFKRPVSFEELKRKIQRAFGIRGFWATEPHPKRVRRIGFVAGKGSSFISSARAVGCDVYLTGEVGYHAALEAKRSGLSVFEVGNREGEKFYLKVMTEWVKAAGLRAKTLDLPTQSVVY